MTTPRASRADGESDRVSSSDRDATDDSEVGADAHEREATARARRWLAEVYKGDDVPQLTVRAVITGMALGGVMALSNLYVGLKIGFSLGVTITSCILAYGFFSSLQRVVPRLREKEFTILENNMMSSVASAAGCMSGSIFVSAIPALYLSVHQALDWPLLAAWAAAVSFLGVFMAIPMKRQQIDIEELPFPSGIATAETLTAMHARDGDSREKAWALGAAGSLGALVAWFRDAHAKWIPFNLPGDPIVPAWSLGGQPFARLSLGLDPSLVMVGAGAIIGIRAGVSIFLSALVCYGIVGPYVLNQGLVDLPLYRQKWALWPGVGLLVASGLTSFLFRWRSLVRAFRGVKGFFSGDPSRQRHPFAEIEAPPSWLLGGVALSGAACVILGAMFFHIAWWMGIIAVLATFLLALVASRTSGETDIPPVSAMGKVTQLIYGVIAPGNMTTNLMTASITGGAAIHTADLMADLKAGYLLGANPRKQVLAQIFGVMSGTLFVVPAYLFLVDPRELGSDKWPAPAAQVWAGVAKVLAGGPGALPTGASTGMLFGALAGVVLAVIEEIVPSGYRKYTLSSAAVGVAWIVPGWNSLSMFVGALIAWLFQRLRPRHSERYSMAVASGLITGESLIAVLIGALVTFKILE